MYVYHFQTTSTTKAMISITTTIQVICWLTLVVSKPLITMLLSNSIVKNEFSEKYLRYLCNNNEEEKIQ